MAGLDTPLAAKLNRLQVILDVAGRAKRLNLESTLRLLRSICGIFNGWIPKELFRVYALNSRAVLALRLCEG